MTNTTLDEYTHSYAPFARTRNVADDSGRDVDHRRTPGAFGDNSGGFVLENAAVDPANDATWVPGAIHHPDHVVAKPAGSARTDEPQETSGTTAVTDTSTPRASLARRLLRGTERALWNSAVVHRVLTTVAKAQRRSADRIEAWMDREPETLA